MVKSFLKQTSLHPIRLLIGVMMLWTLVCVGLLSIYHHAVLSNVSQANSQDTMERLGEMYSNIIEKQWGDGDQVEFILTQLRENEERVKSVTLINRFAGILSPKDKMFEVLSDPPLDKVLSDTPMLQFSENGADKKMYIPLLSAKGSLYGAMIVRYSNDVLSNVGGSGFYIGVAMVLCVISALLAYGVFLLLMQPWQNMSKEVETALADIKVYKDIDVNNAYTQLNQHQFLYRRLLRKLKHMHE